MCYFRIWQTTGQMDDFLTLLHAGLRYFETFHTRQVENGGKTSILSAIRQLLLIVMRQSTQPEIGNVTRIELLAKMESHDRS